MNVPFRPLFSLPKNLHIITVSVSQYDNLTIKKMARRLDLSDFNVEPEDESPPNPNLNPLLFLPADSPAAARVRANIASFASQNSELLATLASTEEAPDALAAHAAHLTSLQAFLSEAEAAHKNLTNSVNASFKRHKRYRDSVTRKFYYRITHMLPEFQARAKQESNAYFVALREQSQSEERLKKFQTQVAEAEQKKVEVEAEAKRHGETHEKVDQLYESIFKGPTPGFPDEDELEERFNTAKDRHGAVKADIVRAIRAGRYLGQAASQINRANDLATNGRFEAEQSIFSFSAAYALLGLSTYFISRTCLLVDKAIETLEYLDPAMEEAKSNLARLLEAARVQRENRVSDEDLVDRVVEAQARLSEAKLKLDELVRAVKGRERAGREAITKTARTLENARQGLQQRREAAFEETVGFGAAAPAYLDVPTYHECCDRADGFCQVDDPEPPAFLEEEEWISVDGMQVPIHGKIPIGMQDQRGPVARRISSVSPP